MSTPARVRTRFAPSPTGYLHVGGLRTALYSYLFAKQHGGQLILRIEDTDQTRLVPDATEKLIATLARVGLQPDEGPDVGGQSGPYVQSQRLALYQQHAKQLVDANQAYYCFCSSERLAQVREQKITAKEPPMYDRHCADLSAEEVARRLAAGEAHVIRLRVPAGKTTLTDLVWGEVTVDNATIDDQVLLKTDGFPTYHLAVVVDDHLMEITHVLRGEEWLPSTPKHLLLYRAFGWEPPQFAHLPLLLNADRSKLSKRQGDVAVEDFLAAGYLPEAIINFVALLGWHPGAGETEEIFSVSELMKRFSLEHIHKAGAIFSQEKLNWINAHYIRQLPIATLVELTQPYLQPLLEQYPQPAEYVARVLQLEQERLVKLADSAQQTEYFFVDQPQYPPELLVWKKSTPADAQRWLVAIQSALVVHDDWSQTALEKYVRQWIADQKAGNGDVLWPLRVALTGREKSPSPFEVAAVLGKDRSRARIAAAIKVIQPIITPS